MQPETQTPLFRYNRLTQEICLRLDVSHKGVLSTLKTGHSWSARLITGTEADHRYFLVQNLVETVFIWYNMLNWKKHMLFDESYNGS